VTTRPPLRIFCSYAHEDDKLRQKLEKHLSSLKRDGSAVLWSDRRIVAGTDWRAGIEKELDQADLVLLLISSDFIDSEFCYSKELQRALERFARREAMVIPVALRAVEWTGTPLEGLQALPRDAKPVTLWADKDKALADVARGVREAVQHFAEWRRPASSDAPPAAGPDLPPRADPGKAVVPEPQAAPAPKPPPFLKRVFGEVDFRPVRWFEEGLAAARAIARVESHDGQPIGTGFLVAASDFGLGAEGESLLLTCWYIARDAGHSGPDGPPVAVFERLDVRRAFKDDVWSSPLGEFDVAFVRLDAPVAAAPCALSRRAAGEMDETTPIYVAGHPLGGSLQFSLWKTAWIDYEAPRLHYRASTEAGSGGSAVFDEDWHVVAVHRAAGVHMRRLHGTGSYAACEGMSLLDIRDAIAASQRKSPKRGKVAKIDIE
jgi:hypothetical protein